MVLVPFPQPLWTSLPLPLIRDRQVTSPGCPLLASSPTVPLPEAGYPAQSHSNPALNNTAAHSYGPTVSSSTVYTKSLSF